MDFDNLSYLKSINRYCFVIMILLIVNSCCTCASM